MERIKISILLTSSSVIDDYEAIKKRHFWNDISDEIYANISDGELAEEPTGAFQRHFYVVTNITPDGCKKAVLNIIDALLPKEINRKHIIVSVFEEKTESEEAEFPKKLPQNPSVTKKIDSNDAKAKKSEPSSGSLKEKANTDSGSAKNNPAVPQKETLYEKTTRLRKVKEQLLKKVHGQRHAIDEVIETVFEMEMFSANDPSRKGPLATFLFTGPSGVGKTYLAKELANRLGRESLIIDMSEYSDFLSNGKFNGDHGQPAVVTAFVKKHPDGILIFDEIEKAHLNTIHLFLQILDGARMTDHSANRSVSFRNNIIIMTTNAGRSLYDDTTVCDLSQIPRSVILEALGRDCDPQSGNPIFPQSIITRMANGHVILFNHLEPYALMNIIKDELSLQISLFEESSGIKVDYEANQLASLILYSGGGTSDARNLTGLTRSIISRELQELMMQLNSYGEEALSSLQKINITVDTSSGTSEALELFNTHTEMMAAVFCNVPSEAFVSSGETYNTKFTVCSDCGTFKANIRGITDYILIDPFCGKKEGEQEFVPNDVDDIISDGMYIFNYAREFYPDIPIYILDTSPNEKHSFETLLAKGARGVISYSLDDSSKFNKALDALCSDAKINNVTFSLGRTAKKLSYNCAQFRIDATLSLISFGNMFLKKVPSASDMNIIARKEENDNIRFADIVGCETAIKTLKKYCDVLENPRQAAISNKDMPKGVLLYGPPGTGKTLLAKAMANECGATFIPVNGTTFFSPYHGQTGINIHNIFIKAKKYAPSVIFIDEVDAIARERTGAESSIHYETALNSLLAEMDGFVSDKKRPVFVLAATNYDIEGNSEKVLDKAFVRRFNNRIHIPLPDTSSRYTLLEKIMEKHSINFGKDHVQALRNMASRTGGMNNSDIEKMALNYIDSLDGKEPDRKMFMDSLDAFLHGDIRSVSPEKLRQTATHEAGHALVCKLLGDDPAYLTVVSRGNFSGYMTHRNKDEENTTYRDFLNRICVSLAGRIAEIEVFGLDEGVNTGAGSDLKNARHLVYTCIHDFAMGDDLYTHKEKEAIECEQLLMSQYEKTTNLIKENKKVLIKLADTLVKKNCMDETALKRFFKENNITPVDTL